MAGIYDILSLLSESNYRLPFRSKSNYQYEQFDDPGFSGQRGTFNATGAPSWAPNSPMPDQYESDSELNAKSNSNLLSLAMTQTLAKGQRMTADDLRSLAGLGRESTVASTLLDQMSSDRENGTSALKAEAGRIENDTNMIARDEAKQAYEAHSAGDLSPREKALERIAEARRRSYDDEIGLINARAEAKAANDPRASFYASLKGGQGSASETGASAPSAAGEFLPSTGKKYPPVTLDNGEIAVTEDGVTWTTTRGGPVSPGQLQELRRMWTARFGGK